MAKSAKRAIMGGNMKGRMAGNGGSSSKYKVGLASGKSGRVRTSTGRSGYATRLGRAGEG
jgi:hypothetical protein